VIDRCAFAARSMSIAHAALASEATNESASPSHTWSSGCGSMRRGTDVHTIAPAATKMSAPSMPLEKYFRLLVAEVVLVVRLFRSVCEHGRAR
jgi:hypothetical protein